MRKTTAALLLSAALAGLLMAPALAAGQTDLTYSGALDPRTGLPLEQSAASGDYYPLRGQEHGYDRSNHCYTNRLGNLSFTSSIPNGAVLSSGQTKPVSIGLPAGLSGTLYRNGDEVTEADLTRIAQAGSYVLEVRSTSGADSLIFSFDILGPVTNSLAEISLPDGFSFESVTLDGDGISPDYSDYLELPRDGHYELCWSCPDIAQRYTVDFTLDTQAPTLALPEVTDGQARSTVTLSDLEEGAYILLESEGETQTITSASTVIRDAGNYTLTVYDQAGNSTRYSFIIHVYLNLSAAAAIGLMLVCAGGLFGYSRYIRTHPRVG